MTPILSKALLNTQSDARLAMLAAKGSEAAYETIVERYRKPLERRCRRMLGREDAEDAVQQAFVRAWSALRAEGEVRDLRAWLFRIAYNTSIDVRRTSRFDYQELEDSLRGAESPEADVERAAVIRKTLAGVAELPDAQREALMRIAIDGDSRAEVASEMGVSEGAVRQLVFRARSRLRAAASAFVPLPLVTWAAELQGGGGQMSERIAQIAGAGGSAGLPAAVKAGAVLASVAAVATAPVAVERVVSPHARHHSAERMARPDSSNTSGSGTTKAKLLPVAAPLNTGSESETSHRQGGSGRSAADGRSGRSHYGSGEADDQNEHRGSSTGQSSKNESERGDDRQRTGRSTGESNGEDRSGESGGEDSSTTPGVQSPSGELGESAAPGGGEDAADASGESEGSG